MVDQNVHYPKKNQFNNKINRKIMIKKLQMIMGMKIRTTMDKVIMTKTGNRLNNLNKMIDQMTMEKRTMVRTKTWNTDKYSYNASI